MQNKFKDYLKDFSRNESGILKVTEDSKIANLIYEAHEGRLPSNLVFEIVYRLVLTGSEYGAEIDSDEKFEIIDACVDLSLHSLLAWASEFFEYVDEATHEYGNGDSKLALFDILQRGQHYHYDLLFELILNS